MAIWARKPESTWETCPEGLHHAVCVDVIDLGLVATKFGDKPKVRIVWQIEDRDGRGARFRASQMYTPSLNEKSALRPMLEAWRGRKFTAAELEGFDLEKLVGANGQIQVVHNMGDNGNTYANVQAVVPAPKGALKLVVDDYVRECDRPKAGANGATPAGGVDDDSIPF